MAEAISYILASLILKITGRRNATSFLLITASASILFLLIIPSNFEYFTIGVALLGRLCVSGVFCVTIIHAFELFPTVARSRALSSSSIMAHFGSIFAPFLVDFFVSQNKLFKIFCLWSFPQNLSFLVENNM